MTVVIGTAGHIDHGKTSLLRALTGIDADRLPEERRRGMTIDVGYAHLTLDDGTTLDFVDVPGHDRLVGNMLVGAGEIDAVLLVVAADDGPRAQTKEHLALLDALAIAHGLAVVTKTDVVEPDRVAAVVAEVAALLSGTSLAGSPVLSVSAMTGAGVEAVRDAIVALRDAVLVDAAADQYDVPASLAIDRVFSVKGRGAVVTGSLRGASLASGMSLRLVPGEAAVRVREIQVHGASVDRAEPGRTALNLAGVEMGALHRGQVLTADPDVVGSSRFLVVLARPMADRAKGRLHVGTAAADATVGRAGRDAVDLDDGRSTALIRTTGPVALRAGDHFLLRRSGGADLIVGGRVLDVDPPRGLSRRRATTPRMTATIAAVEANDRAAQRTARLDRHGVTVDGSVVALAPDVAAAAATAALGAVATEAPSATVRAAIARSIRRVATVRRDDLGLVTGAVLDGLVRGGRLVRAGDLVRRSDAVPVPPDPPLLAAMDRLERALATSAPPSLSAAAREARCGPDGLRQLEREGRIVRLSADLAYAATSYAELTATALALAAKAPLTPAAFRDATGTSRKYVMAVLEDLDRRGILRRTPDGHRPGPKAAAGSAPR